MAKQKRTLEGFGSPATSGQSNLASTMKNLGKMLSTKGVRPVGGNTQGVTSVGRGNTGDIKMKPVGGKSVCCAKTGQGPKDVSQLTHGMTTKNIGGKNLPKDSVRQQP